MTIRGNLDWRECVERGADHRRTDVAKLVDAAPIDYLRAKGFAHYPLDGDRSHLPIGRSSLMSTITSPPMPTPPCAPWPPPRITVDEYDRMTEAGVLANPARIELINGFLVEKMSKSPGHTYSTLAAHETPRRPAPGRMVVAAGATRSDPRVRRAGAGRLRRAGLAGGLPGPHPRPADIAMLVEVSHSSLAFDQGEKLLVYAKAGIPIYWVVNLVNGQVEVYSDPGPGGYRSHQVLAPGHVLSVVVNGVEVGEIPVSDILP